MDRLTEIRARDALADRCKRDGCCGDAFHVIHTETSAECEARRRMETDGKRGCDAWLQHHDYEPGGISGWSDGDRDRRDLLAEVDRLLVVEKAALKAARKMLMAVGR